MRNYYTPFEIWARQLNAKYESSIQHVMSKTGMDYDRTKKVMSILAETSPYDFDSGVVITAAHYILEEHTASEVDIMLKDKHLDWWTLL